MKNPASTRGTTSLRMGSVPSARRALIWSVTTIDPSSAAIPEPTRNPPHVVFRNNLMATFNVIEAAIRTGTPRVVNISSETVPGFFFPEREFLPDYAPVDEEHPIRPQDPYATAKHFGEQLMDAVVRRSDLTGVSIRPSSSPVAPSTTYQTAPSSDGRKIVAPSGVIDMRSQPASYARAHSTLSVRRSTQMSRLMVLT